MNDSFAASVIVVVGAFALLLVASRYRQDEVRWIALSFSAHVVAAVAQVLITEGLYGGGDIFGYALKGEILSATLRVDFESAAWEMLKVLFQQPANPPVPFAGIGSSTGSMTAIATFIYYFTGGGIYTGCVFLGIAAFYGKLAIYEVFRAHFPARIHRRLLFAVLLVPSVVFWSSGLLKESVAMIGLGPVVLGAHRLLTGRPAWGLLLLTVGGLAVGLVKAYILFAFALAAGAWLYATLASSGRTPQLRPIHMLLGLALATLGIALLSSIFPQYALDALAEQATAQQEVGQIARGTSTYELVREGTEASISAQLAYAPIALLTSLYRPLIIEANSPQILVNALETTALLVMTGMVAWRVSFRTVWQTILASPMAIFSLSFVIIFGVAVGLATTNLGTLSRYRMPLVPFFAALLVVLLDSVKSRAEPPSLSHSPSVEPRGPFPSPAAARMRRDP